ncbi:helix-turn-helix domain-containing protein [Roseomonas sp. GCM10028921]
MSKTARPEASTSQQAGIGQRIRWTREAAGLSLRECSEVIGVHYTTLSKIENGDRAPSILNIIALSGHFSLPADFFLRGYIRPQVDGDLALRLVAHHPEIVLGSKHGDDGRGRLGAE